MKADLWPELRKTELLVGLFDKYYARLSSPELDNTCSLPGSNALQTQDKVK